MKAERSVQLALLDVQALDSELLQLSHRAKTLPEIAHIAELDEKLATLNDNRVKAQTELSDQERALKKSEEEVELVRTRRVRDEERLNSGAITNPKDLTNLQNEIAAIDRRIGVLEDAELEIMETLEAARAVADQAVALTSEADAAKAELVTARDTQLAEIEAKRADLLADREVAVPRVSEDLLALYTKLAGQYGGLAAGVLERGRCSACRLELNSSDLREVLAKPADDVVRCPECNRILVRTLDAGA